MTARLSPNPSMARPPEEQAIGLDLARTLWPEEYETARTALGALKPTHASTAHLDGRLILFVWADRPDGESEAAGMAAITRVLNPMEWERLKDNREIA